VGIVIFVHIISLVSFVDDFTELRLSHVVYLYLRRSIGFSNDVDDGHCVYLRVLFNVRDGPSVTGTVAVLT
jgi:hypothetical protein